MSEYKRLRDLAEKATEGPWDFQPSPDRHHADAVYAFYMNREPDHIALVGRSELDQQNADSEYIAAANPAAILSLLYRMEEMERVLQQIHDGAENQNIGHVDFRVKARHASAAALKGGE